MPSRLYGVKGAVVEEVVSTLEERFCCDFQERESDYFGVYWLAVVKNAKIKVAGRLDPDGELLESGFADYETLIYVEGVLGSDLDGIQSQCGVIEALRGGGR